MKLQTVVDQVHREGHLHVGIPYLAGSRYCTRSELLHVISRESGENGMPITLPDLGLYLTASDTDPLLLLMSNNILIQV